jgi:hypothetical protein
MGGAGRREHHRALKTLGCDVHAAFTALLKAGVERRTKAEKHDSAPRIAGSDCIRGTNRAHTFLEQFAIRHIPVQFHAFGARVPFHFARVISF